jgi:hypothetical protein
MVAIKSPSCGDFIFSEIFFFIVNGIRNSVFGLAGANVYGSCKSREQKFVMSFTINARLMQGWRDRIADMKNFYFIKREVDNRNHSIF